MDIAVVTPAGRCKLRLREVVGMTEAASILAVSVPTVTAWMRSGRLLGAVVAGRRVLDGTVVRQLAAERAAQRQAGTVPA